jgi:hypothetical protein
VWLIAAEDLVEETDLRPGTCASVTTGLAGSYAPETTAAAPGRFGSALGHGSASWPSAPRRRPSVPQQGPDRHASIRRQRPGCSPGPACALAGDPGGRLDEPARAAPSASGRTACNQVPPPSVRAIAACTSRWRRPGRDGNTLRPTACGVPQPDAPDPDRAGGARPSVGPGPAGRRGSPAGDHRAGQRGQEETAGNNPSQDAAVNADGRFVAFTSLADNLVRRDRNNVSDVFVRDRQRGTTERVSVSSAGVEGNDDSGTFQTLNEPSISADGRFVAFDSLASNLVPGDTNGAPDLQPSGEDVFVRDRQTGPLSGSASVAPARRAPSPAGLTRPSVPMAGSWRSPPRPTSRLPAPTSPSTCTCTTARRGPPSWSASTARARWATTSARSRLSAPTGALWPSPPAPATWSPGQRQRLRHLRPR